MTDSETPDRIQRSVVINAPLQKVWRALSNAEEFGAWFGANLTGQNFEPGRRARGPVTQPGFEHAVFDVVVERVVPLSLLSFRWHPYCEDPELASPQEPPTLVEFTLAHVAGHQTLLTVTESGFSRLNGRRRFEAFRMNSQGWVEQLDNLARHAQT